MFLFFFAFSCFMTSPTVAAMLFLHIFHVVRAIVGGFLVYKLPRSS